MRLEKILERFEGATPCGDGYMVKCPYHNDKTPSLSIREVENGNILMYCHAGCETENIIAAVDLEWQDLFNNRRRKNYE
jgi:DNA primase